MEREEFEGGEVNRFDDEKLEQEKQEALAVEALMEANENGESDDILEENN
jgi:hypothetical protein